MTQFHGVRRVARWWMLAGVVAVVASGCRRAKPANPTIADLRSQLIAEMQGNYTFDPERPAVQVSDTVLKGPGGRLPTITIATAKRTSTVGRDTTSAFVARLNSNAAYKRMGLAPGMNYLWHDTASVANGGPHRTLVVPADSGYPMVWLKLDTTVKSYVTPMVQKIPQLAVSSLSYGGCIDCGSTGHCAHNVANGALNEKDVSTIRIITHQ
jgi:hypothetical protein